MEKAIVKISKKFAGLNIRAQAATDAQVIGTLPAGAQLYVDSFEKDEKSGREFAKISGFVDTDFLEIEHPLAEPGKPKKASKKTK